MPEKSAPPLKHEEQTPLRSDNLRANLLRRKAKKQKNNNARTAPSED